MCNRYFNIQGSREQHILSNCPIHLLRDHVKIGLFLTHPLCGHDLCTDSKQQLLFSEPKHLSNV